MSGASVGMLLSHFSGVLQEQSIREIEFSGVDLLEGEMYVIVFGEMKGGVYSLWHLGVVQTNH